MRPNPYRLEGYPWQPFDPPIPVPTTDPIDGASNSVSFNDEWMPLVLGALKILTRPEIWDAADRADIELTIQRAHMLIASVEEFSGLCPEFYPDFSQRIISWDTSFTQMQAIDTGDCHGNEREWSSDCSLATITSVASWAVDFFAVMDDSYSGGLVDELYCQQTDNTVANVFTLHWIDCADVQHLDTFLATNFVKRNFQAKAIAVQSLALMSVDLGISGQILCSEA